MESNKGKNTQVIKDKTFLLSLIMSLVFLATSLIVNYFASVYASKNASNPVTDIILDNIRPLDVDGLFVYGGIFLIILIIILCFLNFKRAPFIIKSVSLFVFIRSIFISLTHIGTFPTQIELDPKHLGDQFFFTGDLFFSGHTGLPFLMALIYWHNKPLRYFFITLSLVFGAVVLLGHFHYSIDVFSAFFITYSIFQLTKIFFKKDYNLFKNSI